MSHKNLINGTAYDTTGGKCLVNGTSYAVKKGRTLINGTGYDISFKSKLVAGSTFNSILTTVYDIAYGNDYYVICGSYNSTAYIAYTKDPNLGWTKIRLWSSAYMGAANAIKFINDQFVVVGYSLDNTDPTESEAIIAYASLPTTWTTKILWRNYDTTGTTLNSIIHDGSYYIVSGIDYIYDDDDEISVAAAVVARSTSLSGTWEKYWIHNTSGTRNTGQVYMIYTGDYYVTTGYRYNSDERKYCYSIAYATDLCGPWTNEILWSITTGTYNYSSINGISYYNNIIVVYGVKGTAGYNTIAQIYSGSAPDRLYQGVSWTYSQADYTKHNSLNGVIYVNNQWVLSGCYVGAGSDNETTAVYNRISYGASLSTPSLTSFDFWETEANNNNRNYVKCMEANGYLFIFISYDAGDDAPAVSEGKYLVWANNPTDAVNILTQY